MRILDANIFIYAAQPTYVHLRPLSVDPHSVISDVTRLEVLGYHRLDAVDKTYFEAIFRLIVRLPVTETVLDQAILLRQEKKMSLGDSIIAATALLQGYELYSCNTDDISHINGLVVVNPV